MNYKKENKSLVELSGRYSYYDYTEKEIEEIVKKNVKEVNNDEWKSLIQMIYPKNMIASGLFQPILIFDMKKNGERKDSPTNAFNSIDDLKNGTCLLFEIIKHIKKNSNLVFDDSWFKLKEKIMEEGELDDSKRDV